jgi:uncharacterized protein YdeI (YjbR/CyaY-like superfamily)
MSTDKRIDAYIGKSSDFAKPILEYIRKVVHKASPQAEETIKWGFPHFDYKGEMMCAMASFKQHCALNFWKASLMKDPEKLFTVAENSGMGNMGKIRSLKDLPSAKVLTAYIKEAMKLNDEGIKIKAKKPLEKTAVIVPPYFKTALNKNKAAKAVFDNFAPSHIKEYVLWLEEAKTEETRNKRLAIAIEWIAEGKGRNWKYMQKK